MFTGLIEDMGQIVEASPRRGSTRLGVRTALPVAEMNDGDSVAVDGVCLTVAQRRGDRFWADVVAETLSRTTLGGLRPGAAVNLERSLRLGDRLGGHLVLGHADGVARIREISRRGDDVRVRMELPEEMRRYVAMKGSVALQGVSLTVSNLAPTSFEVAVVPETLARTTLGRKKSGDRLNVEVDLLARYLERMLRDDGPGSGWNPGGPDWLR
jgi:riboflavin synthase